MSGRFFTQEVIFYTGPQFSAKYNNAVYGLVALHIIHKTKWFPAFVFATWEQVDNYDDAIKKNTEDLGFNNLMPQPPQLANIPVTRAHTIHSQIPPVNDAVHAAFTAKDPTTIWQYYKLVGVQAAPVNGPPSPTAPMDDLSYYYLANIVVETNQTLQNFFGIAPMGTRESVHERLSQRRNWKSFPDGRLSGLSRCEGAIAGWRHERPHRRRTVQQ